MAFVVIQHLNPTYKGMLPELLQRHTAMPVVQADAQDVLNSLVFSEKQIATRDGRWLKVCIMPYRTLENVIDGVVITFNDSSEAKTLETELRSRQYSASGSKSEVKT